MNTALLVICTGTKYHQYINPLLNSAAEFFVPHTPILWTDSPDDHVFQQIEIPHEGFPNATLKRYHWFTRHAAVLSQYDQVFYTDVDMLMVAPVGEEIFSDGITATLHPGYVGTRGTPETHPKSFAFTPNNTAYYCGGFNGGDARAFLTMAEDIKDKVDADERNGVVAVWHDESHLNRYLADNPPAKVLDPSYCYPEHGEAHYTDKWHAAGLNVTPKILALEKS